MVFYRGQRGDSEYYRQEEIGRSDQNYGEMLAVTGRESYDSLRSLGYRSAGRYDDFNEAINSMKMYRGWGSHAIIWSSEEGELPYFVLVRKGFTGE